MTSDKLPHWKFRHLRTITHCCFEKKDTCNTYHWTQAQHCFGTEEGCSVHKIRKPIWSQHGHHIL